ncbi:MAG: cupin domain-containing protein [Planctomycetes bacterium]|nr:cupin domain-containing protein [Planctomycetota bacterium]
MTRYHVTHMNDIAPKPCPCGTSKRAFADLPDSPASLHIVEIKTDAQTHYHKKMTEIYHVLEGDGVMELDGQQVPIRPGSTIQIRPGCRHRAIGKLKIINVAIPAFDENDEWFD